MSDRVLGVWGVGREGAAAVRALHHDYDRLIVVADDPAAQPPDNLPANATFAAGPQAVDRLLECGTVVVSPGVPGVHPMRARLADAAVAVTSGTALWMSAHRARCIGVTGTKGKSATASLIDHLLRAAGDKSRLGGNVGSPLLDIGAPAGTVVAELSSYQCASLDVAPRVAVITNLFQDHLTWHGGLERYWRDKARIVTRGADVLVASDDVVQCLDGLGVMPARVVPPAEIPARDDLPEALRPPHMQANLALAVAAARVVSMQPELAGDVAPLVADWEQLPHRLATVAEVAGVRFVDDTLATTTEAVISALESFDGPVVAIVGGQDRGVDYSALQQYARDEDGRVRFVAYGANGDAIVAPFEQEFPSRVGHARTMREAVAFAALLLPRGGTVTLSPGAPSHDAYEDYRAKSADFATAVDAYRRAKGDAAD